MNYYKLTDQNRQTYGGFQWELGKRYSIDKPDKDKELCSNGWFHCYCHPLLAVFLNPIHAGIDNPKLFEIEVGGLKRWGNGLKFGFTEMTLVKRIYLPELTVTQCIAIGILCVKRVYYNKHWSKWANGWLSGEDRSKESATNATVRDAAAAGYAAAYAAYAAGAVHAAVVVTYAADAAINAVYATSPKHPLDLIGLIEKVKREF